MKRYLFITSAIFVMAVLTRAQTNVYHPFPDKNAVWIQMVIQPWPSPPIYYITYLHPFRDDTIINTKTYIKVFRNSNGNGGAYRGAYRSDISGKVYFVPKDSVNEYLLFDFSKNAGDTIYNVLALDYPFVTLKNLVVSSTTYVTVGPYQLKVLFLGNYTWVEKIGCLGGGLDNLGCGVPSKLICMSANDTVYYEPHYLGDCIFSFPYRYDTTACSFFTGITQHLLKNSIEIFPNPTSDKITIENLPEEKMILNITNVFGQKIYYTQIQNTNSFSLSLNELNEGIYFLSIYSVQNGFLLNKKIIKQ